MECKYCDFNEEMHEKGCPNSFEEHLLCIVSVVYLYNYNLAIKGFYSGFISFDSKYGEVVELAIRNARREIKKNTN